MNTALRYTTLYTPTIIERSRSFKKRLLSRIFYHTVSYYVFSFVYKDEPI